MTCKFPSLLPADLAILNRAIVDSGYQLVKSDKVLQLLTSDRLIKPLFIDFVGGKNLHRRLFGGGKKQPLARAVGISKGYLPRVLDVTAGMGRDAYVLASLGCAVEMIERVPVISALLADALNRALADEQAGKIVDRMLLRQVDSIAYLKDLPADAHAEVIYMDPMYPHRGKSALVKKEMRIFRELAGDDADSVELLYQARQVARRRVTVKRPKGAEYLGGVKPHFQVSSPNTRYDIYLADKHNQSGKAAVI